MSDLGAWPSPTVSASALNRWTVCRRAFFWSTYCSWGGWEKDAPRYKRLAYVLKKSVGAYSKAGMLVHLEATRLVRAADAGRPLPDRDSVVERVQRKMREWARQAVETTVDTASKAKPLSSEVFYGRSIPVDAAIDKAEVCIANLYDSEHLEYLLEATPKDVGPGESASPVLLLDQSQPVKIDLDGWTMKLWAAPDLVYEGGRGEVRIVDWKTGKERGGDRHQLELYALWVVRFGTVTAGRTLVLSADYLETGMVREHSSKTTLANARQTLETFAGELAELVDTATNAPHVDPATQKVDPKRWPKLAEGSSACASCDFRVLCRRDI